MTCASSPSTPVLTSLRRTPTPWWLRSPIFWPPRSDRPASLKNDSRIHTKFHDISCLLPASWSCADSGGGSELSQKGKAHENGLSSACLCHRGTGCSPGGCHRLCGVCAAAL